jgi:hypothetical protein
MQSQQNIYQEMNLFVPKRTFSMANTGRKLSRPEEPLGAHQADRKMGQWAKNWPGSRRGAGSDQVNWLILPIKHLFMVVFFELKMLI